jgi:3'-phosphoadenosine 5'-phosphosulfate sulfotransferase (PAPS reductase)/FAD synthetase
MKVSSIEYQRRVRLPLAKKVEWALRQIRIWHDVHDGRAYVSFSGGKDSTVLLHLVRSLYPDVPAVFANTGLEFPEIVKFVRNFENVTVVRPALSFKAVLKKYGYPVISKENAGYLREIRTARANGSEAWVNQRLHGIRRDGGRTSFCLPKKWHFMVDAPFAVSEKCCDVMKKRPFRKYARATGRCAIMGTMAADSSLRRQQYLKYGCNAFDLADPASRPLSIWTERDVWNYIRANDIPYSSIYDMGYARTGCVFCMFGVHLEKSPNRFQRLQQTHPKLHAYCMNRLGLRKVLKHIGVQCERGEVAERRMTMEVPSARPTPCAKMSGTTR